MWSNSPNRWRNTWSTAFICDVELHVAVRANNRGDQHLGDSLLDIAPCFHMKMGYLVTVLPGAVTAGRAPRARNHGLALYPPRVSSCTRMDLHPSSVFAKRRHAPAPRLRCCVSNKSNSDCVVTRSIPSSPTLPCNRVNRHYLTKVCLYVDLGSGPINFLAERRLD